jgi:hypothetical protein
MKRKKRMRINSRMMVKMKVKAPLERWTLI